MINREEWKKFGIESSPFLQYEFLEALIESESIGEASGWTPLLVQRANAGILTFFKTHSYGEFIFDWAWAEAYQRYGFPYYPKLTSMIPFTPVTTKHFLMEKFDFESARSLLMEHDENLNRNLLSSAHFLFIEKKEIEVFRAEKYLIRESLQYHFQVPAVQNFEGYLSLLKTKKAKSIRKERVFPGVLIKRITGSDLTQTHAKRMFEFYYSTIDQKGSFPYLKETFFNRIFDSMKNNILYVEATRGDLPVGAAFFFYDEEKLYGRYWGANEYLENLHFELCYYQGIDFCLEKKIKIFEAGAQGEHKISRGFRPTIIHSAHKLKDSSFSKAVEDFIAQEQKYIREKFNDLEDFLPFK